MTDTFEIEVVPESSVVTITRAELRDMFCGALAISAEHVIDRVRKRAVDNQIAFNIVNEDALVQWVSTLNLMKITDQ